MYEVEGVDSWASDCLHGIDSAASCVLHQLPVGHLFCFTDSRPTAAGSWSWPPSMPTSWMPG